MPPRRRHRSTFATTPHLRAGFRAAMRRTPARLGVGRAGPRYTTAAQLRLRADHARAVDAVMTEVAASFARINGILEVSSRAATREQFLLRPELGRALSAADAARLRRIYSRRRSATPSILICVGDGLSSAAVEANAPTLLRALRTRLSRRFDLLPPLFIRNARVRIEDQIGEITRADVVVMLVGERPGLATAESLSAYVIYRPTRKSAEPDRTVISNIHRGGIKLPAATRKIVALIADVLRLHATGAKLAHLLSAQARPRSKTGRTR
ncbi:MAG: ethanolamine ammonia-lyase subunit EutC [Burkholderiales bacterium]